jgi:pimeloyl-ACP methyl ester carboxylesterase
VSAAGTVEDLHTLLDVAEVPGPYVLLGGSRGGAVAFVYAGTYPDDVAGLVLLDPDVPGTTAWIIEFLDPELLIPVDEFRDLWLNELWRDDPELMNEFGLGEAIDAAAGSVPAVPAILLIPEESAAPPDFGEGAAEAYRELQEAAMDLFEPGEVRPVDAPHDMIPVIPEEIAAAVREVIDASSAAEVSATSAPTTSN